MNKTMKALLSLALSLCLLASAAATALAEGETVIVTDVRGDVTIPANPQRIVDLSGNSDILYILGYTVVGTANSDAYDYTRLVSWLEEPLKDATILGYSYQDTMNIEAVIACEPDLIIISNVQERMYDQLSEIAPTLMIVRDGTDWSKDVETLAKLLDREAEAEAWLAAYRARAAQAGEQIRAAFGEETTYLSFLASYGSFYIFANAGIGDVMYNAMGLARPEGLPDQADVSLPTATYEGLAAIGGDVVIAVCTDDDRAELESNAIWNALPAVRNGRVVYLDSDYFTKSYSCIGCDLLLDEFAEILHGIQ